MGICHGAPELDRSVVQHWATGCMMGGVRVLAETGNLSLHHHVQNGSGAQPASYSMGTRGSYPGGKAAGA